jgi:polar amino acid transport system substrate-binding protein
MSRCLASVVALFSFFVLIGSLSAEADSALDRIKSKAVLVVATDPNWAPMSWRKENGEFDGFDVDVSKELARRMGVGVEFYLPYSFEDVLAGNWGDKWDVATSVTPTVQRAEKVQFATVYWYGPGSLAVHRDSTSIEEPSEASNKTIGVVKGTEYEKYLTREAFDIADMPSFTYKIDRPNVVTFADEDALYAALAKGDGVVIDGIIDSMNGLMQQINNGAPFRLVGQPLTYTPSSLVVDRGDNDLAAALKEIVEAMQKDGTLMRLSMKWFDFDLSHF